MLEIGLDRGRGIRRLLSTAVANVDQPQVTKFTRRGTSIVFLSAGLVEGLTHFRRLQRLSDLALAAVID
ncbi:MAG: hypothetical protein WAL22_00625 [Solirubrobacteraceae bacterium]